MKLDYALVDDVHAVAEVALAKEYFAHFEVDDPCALGQNASLAGIEDGDRLRRSSVRRQVL